jgi:hypothetical protein
MLKNKGRGLKIKSDSKPLDGKNCRRIMHHPSQEMQHIQSNFENSFNEFGMKTDCDNVQQEQRLYKFTPLYLQ